MPCIVLECDHLADDSRGLCAQHLRRMLSGQVYEEDNGELVDHCIKDHPLVGDNVRWESSGKKGKKRRRCRECLKEKAQRQARNHIPAVDFPSPYRPSDLSLTQAIADFEEARASVGTKCRDNPGPYSDWTTPLTEWASKADEPGPPTPEEAERLCAGCPVRRACRNYAIAAKETHGVWGGGVLVDGVWQ